MADVNPTPSCLGSFGAARYAPGHKALHALEINGGRASIRWDPHGLHRLSRFDHGHAGKPRGWRSIRVTDGDHPCMGRWWVPGLQVGCEHGFTHQVADVLAGLDGGPATVPTFAEALNTDKVTDAVLASAADRRWGAAA